MPWTDATAATLLLIDGKRTGAIELTSPPVNVTIGDKSKLGQELIMDIDLLVRRAYRVCCGWVGRMDRQTVACSIGPIFSKGRKGG